MPGAVLSEADMDALATGPAPRLSADMLNRPFLAPPSVAEPLNAPREQRPPAGPASPVLNDQDLERIGAGTHGALYAIDYTAPEAQVRRSIARLPQTMRDDAMRIWADTYVQRENRTATGIEDRVRAVARGTLFGSWLDEANAATQGILNTVSGGAVGTPYDEAVAYNRARDRAFDRENPLQSAGLQLAGGIASAVPVLGAPTSVTNAIGRGLTYGATAGAIHGAGNAEGDVGDRIAGAGSGALVGGTLGAVLPVGVAGITRAAGAIRDAVNPVLARWRGGPDAAAEQVLAQQIARAGTTPAAIRLDLQQGQRAAHLNSNSNATLPEAIADTSDAMRRLTGSVYRAGGEAGDFTRAAIEARQRGPANPYAPQAGEPAGQAENVLDALARALGIRSQDSAQRTRGRISAEMRREGDALYATAKANTEAFDLQNVLTAQAMQAMQYPPPFAARLQRAINLFTEARPNGSRFPVTTIERFDNAKKALDDMISTAERGGNGNLMRELTRFKNALLDEVHGGSAANPTRNVAYAEARTAWGNRQSDLAAIELGNRALQEGTDATAEAFRQLDRRQRALFSVGLYEAARGAAGPRRSGDDISRLFTTRHMQELLSEVIPASRGNGVFADRPARFGEIINRQARMTQTRNTALGGSPTAQRLNDDAAMVGDTLSTMYSRFRQSPSLTNLGFEAVASVMQRVFAYRQDVALSMARRLLTTDRAEQNRILQAIARRSRDREGLAQFASLLDRMAIATGMTAPGIATGGR